MRYFLVRLPIEHSPEFLKASMATMDEHFAWAKRHHDDGSLLVSGPAADFSCGMLLMKAESREALDDLLGSEPGVASGLMVPEVIEWDVHHILGFGPPFDPDEISKLWPQPAQEAFAAQRAAAH